MKGAKAGVIPADYLERVYAGWLGKVIGVRHGSNIESWTYDRIARTYGEITDYLFTFRHFAADDDTNGPMFFLRALTDFTASRDITAEQIGFTWLNYAPDGHGFFWWGGYGGSTEHTAYLNLKNGIMAPRSGSIEQNGAAVAEQIGGQIFIDVWGLVAPGNPALAAELAHKAASVSHDGNGIYGGMFIAACISSAFVETDIDGIIDAGLAVIPGDCELVRMIRAVRGHHAAEPENWRAGFAHVREDFGYDRYPGTCHIVPNAAVIVLSLLYSRGEFSRAINIANMCGWDTDCNVGNLGTIAGVRGGLAAVEHRWRAPINDFLCCSSVIGSLNMLDIPWCAAYIADLGYKMAGQQPPEAARRLLESGIDRFHFELPGSTHGFEADVSGAEPGHRHVTATLSNTAETAAEGSRSLRILFDHASGGSPYRVFHRTYYVPDDFDDYRYNPAFSPKLYPGQTIRASVSVHPSVEGRLLARLFIRERHSGSLFHGETAPVEPGQWTALRFDIPRMENACIQAAGIEWLPVKGWTAGGELLVYLDDMEFSGLPDYAFDFRHAVVEAWNPLSLEISQFTRLRGLWQLEDGELSGSYFGEMAECYTGRLDWRDYLYSATLVPHVGSEHYVLFRVEGGIRSYAVGLTSGNRVGLFRNENGYRELAAAPFSWSFGEEYRVDVEARGPDFGISINGRPVLRYMDQHGPYLTGMVGLANRGGSHTHYRSWSMKGLE